MIVLPMLVLPQPQRNLLPRRHRQPRPDLRLARQLRSAGLGVELYPEAKKLGQQLKFADRRGFQVAIIAGDQEFERGVCQIKDLQSGESLESPLDSLATKVNQILEATFHAGPRQGVFAVSLRVLT